MKQYWKILFSALTGKNPFLKELEEAKEQLRKSVDNMSAMQTQLNLTLNNWDRCQMRLEESDKQSESLQVLIENLRVRIKEKDAVMKQRGREFQERMEQMKSDYQKRIEEYSREIDRLRNTIKQTK